jgi:hypothetical protein
MTSVPSPEVPPNAAPIVVVPWLKLVAKPTSLTVATLVTEEVQVAEFVRFCTLPSV